MRVKARQTLLTRGWDAVSLQIEALWRHELLRTLADSRELSAQAASLHP